MPFDVLRRKKKEDDLLKDALKGYNYGYDYDFGGVAPPAQAEHLTKLLQEVEKWKKNFILHLQGYTKKAELKSGEEGYDVVWRYEYVGKPMMNDEGINTIISIIDSFFAPELQWSKLSKDIITRTCEDLFCDIAEAIFVNHDRWGVNITSATLIMDEIGHAIYSFLLRAENALLLDRITTASKRTEIVEAHGGEKSGSFFRGIRL